MASARKVKRIDWVLEVTSLSRAKVYECMRETEDPFPQPVQLGPRLNGWWEDEVMAWLEARPRGLRSAEDAQRLRSVSQPSRVQAEELPPALEPEIDGAAADDDPGRRRRSLH